MTESKEAVKSGLFLRQLRAILYKNWLLKRAHIWGFLAELLLPVAFMALLILIKDITSIYDSPDVAYHCGNTAPWYYSSSINTNLDPNGQIPLTCTQEPETCSADHYYRRKVSASDYIDGNDDILSQLSGYTQYGYVATPVSYGASSSPFYSYTIADESSIYDDLGIENPSVTLSHALNKFYKHKAIFVIAPQVSGSDTLMNEASSLRYFILNQTAASTNHSMEDTVVLFDSESSLNSYMTSKNYDNEGYGFGKVGFAVVLYAADVVNQQWEYAIRVNYTSLFDEDDDTVACLYKGCGFTYSIPSTKFKTDDLFKPQNSAYFYGYTYSGFSTVQQIVDQYIFSKYPNSSRGLNSLQSSGDTLYSGIVKIMASVSFMATSTYKTDNFQYVISSTLGIFYMLSFLYPVSRLVRALVIEKEGRIKEGMKMMGLTDTVYNLSWLITALLQMTVVAILIVLVTATSVFQYSNKFYVFIYFEAFSLAVINFCFLLATFFSKAKSASLLGPMIFFAAYFPYYAVNDPQFSTSSKTAACLLAPTCFALGSEVFADYEGGLVGVQKSNAGEITSNFSFDLCVGMMFFDALLYGLLAWYLDKTLPSEYGTQSPLYFPFLPSYWFGVRLSDTSCCKSNKKNYQVVGEEDDHFAGILDEREKRQTKKSLTERLLSPFYPVEESSSPQAAGTKISEKYFEAPSSELQQQVTDSKCLSVRGLRKVFKNAAGGDDRIAVNSLTMDMFQNQVTVLLGHNGAGKSTTISMLVGLIPPTAGDALVPLIEGKYGLDNENSSAQPHVHRSILTDMQSVRSTLGVCPQHDILFTELTVTQHLEIYAAFKGVPSNQVSAQATKMIAEVGLVEKANARAGTLSGGQKRKLSLGIALIGDSKVVVLDEPTSGMDPFSRRSTWNIIRRNKKGRVILLTTHFMDEADILGDRIAIMAHGNLQCVGSSLFLKNKFGVGYTLTIVKDTPVATQQTLKQMQLERSSNIKNLVCRYVPEAEPLSDVGAEQSFRLPFSSAKSFVDLFSEFDANKLSLGIAEYGVSVTTLEEVFIRVGELSVINDANELQAAESNAHHSDDREENRTEKGEAFKLPRIDTNSAFQKPQHEYTHIGPASGRFTPIKSGRLHQKNPSLQKQPSLSFGDSGSLLGAERLSFNGTEIPKGCCEFESDSIFVKHMIALFQKRIVYAKRDTRMICCQLILPVLLVILGVSLLLVKPDLNQPDIILSPSSYNSGKAPEYKNFVPFLSFPDENGDKSIGQMMQEQFNGGDDGNGVYGVAVPINGTTFPFDAFGSCSLGAEPLYNMSQFLMLDQNDIEQGSSRYGAITIADTTNTTQLDYNIMVNGSAIHGIGVYVNLVHSSFLQVLTGNSKAAITIHNHPLPETYQQESKAASTSGFVVSLFCMIAYCFIPASFAAFVVKEREVKAKHQQIISGISIYAYWITTYVWDVLSYTPTAGLTIAVMFAYGVKAFTVGPAASAACLLFLLYGPAIAAFTYLISFMFVSHSTAQIVVMFFNFITGLCLSVVSFVLTTIPSTASISLSLRYLFRIFPSYCLGDGLTQLAMCEEGKDCPVIGSSGYDFSRTQGPFAWDIAGGDLLFLGIQAIVYFLLALLIEYALTFPTLASWLYSVEDPGYRPTDDEDEDVEAERQRILRTGNTTDVVHIRELRKVYPANSNSGGFSFGNIVRNLVSLCVGKRKTTASKDGKVKIKVAVQSLCFGVPKGECFGFLGINGAGKSTTLSILSGEFPPTSGNAFIDGYSIREDQTKIRRKIGYCPQFDALLELLTVREHLELYARIKGFTGNDLEEMIARKIKQLDLSDFENKTAGSLSGGNKRKLSVAVATIGDPAIVFLDEPSTGMDPVARRFMWRVIAQMSTEGGDPESGGTGCSVILTTHSMEEAEALCARIGVMVNGRLRCLGSAQHLKHRFGNGFEVNIRTKSDMLKNFYLGLDRSQAPESEEYSIAGLAARVLSNPTMNSLVHRQKSLSFQGTSSAIAGNLSDKLSDIQNIRVEIDDLQSLCNTLGSAERIKEINQKGSGSIIQEIMVAEGYVSLPVLLDWWISETVAIQLHVYMNKEFHNRAKLLERSTAHNFRYRILNEEDADSEKIQGALSLVFSKFEADKEQLRVSEYSVGQTTLEQIFNQFAAQQDNPELSTSN